MIDKLNLPHGYSLRDLLTEMAEDEGLSPEVRDRCQTAIKSLPKRKVVAGEVSQSENQRV